MFLQVQRKVYVKFKGTNLRFLSKCWIFCLLKNGPELMGNKVHFHLSSYKRNTHQYSLVNEHPELQRGLLPATILIRLLRNLKSFPKKLYLAFLEEFSYIVKEFIYFSEFVESIVRVKIEDCGN